MAVKRGSRKRQGAPSRRGTANARPRKAKYVYVFGAKTDGGAGLRNLLGGKGANLAEMASIGLPVPPGFTISTDVCTYFYAHGKSYPATLRVDVEAALAGVERQQGRRFGDPHNPLLLSVRSGARESMPGMMDTILNLGLNDHTVEGLAEQSGDARFAYDCYRRFIQMYGDVVMGVGGETEESHDPFDELMAALPTMPLSTRSICASWSVVTSSSSGRALTRPSRRTSTISCGARSVRCSARGKTIARSSTGSVTGSPRSGAPP